jgi:nitrile hydratase accessory protein
LPRDDGGPVFREPWAARAFAMNVALNERGVFAWPEWSQLLGARVAAEALANPADPDAYWRAWRAALEDMLARKAVARPPELVALQQAWLRAAAATPHGEPVELSAGR